ncbi:uncharacterized protein VP01_4221g1 [Puccinia sorghi]|uniref:Uncharacterized protein n=1 Tax=Puccinia sorghi TaxID=27349 RepID=A0A0L6URF3_9BASI|nr:uncharacterized protein VP01_4221g1 [Puccinia sorghi]
MTVNVLIYVDKEVRKQIIILDFKLGIGSKKQIDLKFGNATWRRRVPKAFYTSRFDSSTTPVAAWKIDIKLLDLCDGEVGYAVKFALDTTHADIITSRKCRSN